MNNKIQSQHRQTAAIIYLRQSTMHQVMHNQESTQRQYALQQKALDYGWDSSMVQVMDGDLGKSGSNTASRQDFKNLVAEVSMGNVGAIFVLEASRLSRNSTDWNRLLELCSLTRTLIIDQDGCYDPALFNDQLLLGLKGTMSQAELHLIKARLYGAKLNKAKKGELRFPLPIGYIYDLEGNITFDPDTQVQHIIKMIFELYQDKKSAYAVIQHLGRNGIQFPKRAYGGRWKGKLIWGQPTYERVLSILNNPFYAGVYSWGRYKSYKAINEQGEIITKQQRLPMSEWPVMIKDHHCSYISFEEFKDNRKQAEINKTNSPENRLSGPPREGLTLLQGLLYCGVCGRRLTIRYKVNGKCAPQYECNGRKSKGLTHNSCIYFKATVSDSIIEQLVIQALTPENVAIAVNALSQIQRRKVSLNKQYEMNIQRCQYQADLAQRRFEQVDPNNRLVANSLENNWNLELEKLAAAEKEYMEYTSKKEEEFSASRKNEITMLAAHIPDLWHKTKNVKDKKRIIRLLIRDVTVTKAVASKTLTLNIRWQTGQLQSVETSLPQNIAEAIRYSKETVEQVRELTHTHGNDNRTAEILNAQGLKSAKGKPFTPSMIRWIRFKHQIEKPVTKTEHEYTVNEVINFMNVSRHMVYYWIEKKYVESRKLSTGILIELPPFKVEELRIKVESSY